MKATAIYKKGKWVSIFKDPKTDHKKKSARGLLRVNDDFTVSYDQTEEQEKGGLLQTVFKDGELLKETSLVEIRKLVMENINE